MKRNWNITALLLALLLLAGCASAAGQSREDPAGSAAYIDLLTMKEIQLGTEAVALAASPAAIPALFLPEASGRAVEKNGKAVIDYSNTADGYVMVRFTAATDKRLMAQVTGPSTTYTYSLTAGEWAAFPLSDGSGAYQVTVLENAVDTRYALVLAASLQVKLKDEFAPFLYSNQYVDYASAPKTVDKAAELAGKLTDPLEKVEAIYDFVVQSLTYDKEKARTVKSGYLPVLDDVLASKKGICFDYASLMAGMLRSQGVPCKLVVGYAGTAYHAWISVWTEETGWIDGVIFFDGSSWQRMDPTFASSGKGSEAIMNYIGDGSNYTVSYLY